MKGEEGVCIPKSMQHIIILLFSILVCRPTKLSVTLVAFMETALGETTAAVIMAGRVLAAVKVHYR